MKSEENKISYEIRSSSKLWLSRIFYTLVVFDALKLIGAIVSSSGTGIGLTVGSLFVDGVMLMAILKQWKLVLKIARVVIMIEILLNVIAAVLDIVATVGDDKLKKSERNELIASDFFLCLSVLCYAVLARLIGRYTTELESASYA